MTQDAIVTRALAGNMAEVAVTRGTACGGNCGNCESCMFQSELKAAAANPLGAKPGQRVVIESKSSKIYKATVLVYIVPMLLLVLGYVLASALGVGEGLCILTSFLGLAVGGAIIVLSQRKQKKKDRITFEIVQIY